MFSTQLMEWIEEGYQNTLRFLNSRAERDAVERMREVLLECAPDELAVMKYYFGAMPYSDLADTDFFLLKEYARHALFLRREIPWCRDIPEKTFLMDVAAYRINNEKIMDCRALFFEELWERVKGRSMKEAALEINYWCAEHASYHLADARTASALTVYRSGFGRCGEESVFAVTALRSVGIPARQVYTPLWAHCDDNHAWVEAWCDGEWCFLGACEPEEVLNKGWFTGPASRAMLLHAKYFTSLPMEEAEFTEGFVRYVNRISMYAHSVPFTVEVVDAGERPVPGVTVYFELLNASEYREIAAKPTDENGRVCIELGKGDIRIHLVKDGAWTERTVNTGMGFVRLVLDGAQEADGEWKQYLLHAPDFSVIHPGTVTPAQKTRGRERTAQADRMRLERIASYYKEALAKPYPALEKRLRDSAANFDELIAFLGKDGDPYREKLLLALTPKDMYDLKKEVLEEHLQAAKMFCGQYPEEIFVPYLLNPRVEHEELSCYRAFISDFFSGEEKAGFLEDPKRIWAYIQERIDYDESRDFERLRVSPQGALTLRLADPASRRILFCAVCRTLGIPARINRMRFQAEYYRDGAFVSAEEPAAALPEKGCPAGADGKAAQPAKAAEGTVTLVFEPETEWHYFRGWTFSEWRDGLFYPLGLFRTPVEDGKMTLRLKEGIYRALTTVRLPDGDQAVRELTFALKAGEEKTVELKKYRLQTTELLTDRVLSVSEPEPRQGVRRMVLWLEPGKEPTQHVLNELLDNAEVCGRSPERIQILIQSETDAAEPVFDNVMRRLNGLSYTVSANWDAAERIAQELNLQAYQYPLVYVKDERDHVIYADCGYNVGSVDLMLKLLEQ